MSSSVSDEAAEAFYDDDEDRLVIACVSEAGEWVSVDADSAVEIEE